MPCLIGCFALFAPRAVIVILALFSDYVGDAFKGGWLWPILGFFFLPLTTLAYAFGIHENGHIDGAYLALVILGVLIDLGIIGQGIFYRDGKRLPFS